MFEDGAPAKDNGVGGVEYPYKKEGAACTEPAYQGETEYPHEDADHFEGSDIIYEESIDFFEHF